MRKRVRLEELWRKIPGFEGYEISSCGRVKQDGKIKKLYKNNWDYVYVYLGLFLNKGVHVLVCEEFVGPKPFPEAEVNHDNGHKDDNWFGNLNWSTRSANMKHAFEIGLHSQKKGKDNSLSKKYCFVSPDGKVYQGKGLRAFCRKYKLHTGNMSALALGKVGTCKGWTQGTEDRYSK